MAEFKKIDEAKIKNLLRTIPYLVDAENAGGEFSDKCTLILTDGYLAEVLGHMISTTKNNNNYGVLPVGKTNYGSADSAVGYRLLNVREASPDQIIKDADIQHIIQILGLKLGEVYDNDNVKKSLRYGHLMIITNQEQDGIHLKGLLINLFHCLWPSLLKIPSFLEELMIPLVEATGKDGRFLFFYNMPQYESGTRHKVGQVGTRHKGGEYDICAKSAFTKLSPIARSLFPKDDDILLDYPKEDDILYYPNENEQPIEPTWYAPVIPLILVNGCEGVGVGGCSTFVPSYNPRDLCASIRSLLRGEPMVPIHPWYKGFQGTIDKTTAKDSGTSYTISGIINQIDETTLEITELPIRTWTRDYKKFLETAKTRIVTCTDKIMDQLMIKEYYEKYDTTTVYFEIIMSKENLQMAREEGLEKVFRLTTTIHTSNMHLLDKNGVIKKYDNPEQILEEFFELRLELYDKRRNMLLDDLRSELSKLSITRRFMNCVLNHDFNFNVLLDRDATIAELQKNGFDDSCVYMLSWDFLKVFTQREKIMELDSQIVNLSLRLQELEESTPETFWIKDLDALDQKLNELDLIAELDKEN